MAARRTKDQRTQTQRIQDMWAEVHAKADGHKFEPPVRYRVSDIAKRLAATDGAGRSEAYFARQVRGWAQHGLFEPLGLKGSGRTASRVFDKSAIYRAKALSVLTGLGLRPSELHNVLSGFWFDKAVERVQAGEDLNFQIAVGDDGSCFEASAEDKAAPLGDGTRASLYMIFDMHQLLEGLDEDKDEGGTS